MFKRMTRFHANTLGASNDDHFDDLLIHDDVEPKTLIVADVETISTDSDLDLDPALTLPEHNKPSAAWGIIYGQKIKWTVMLGWVLVGLECIVGTWEFVRGIKGGGEVGEWVVSWIPKYVGGGGE